MLTGIHLILTYTCNFECDHCFLYCSPRSEGTCSFAMIKELLDDLQTITTVDSVGFEGGEPFLFYPLLLESVREAAERGFHTAIQTNAYWAVSEQDAGLWLDPLKQAGLEILEVSDDTYHHGDTGGDTPAKHAAAAALKVGLEVDSICIQPPVVQERKPGTRGKPIYMGGPKMRGRAVDKLADGLPVKPWETFTACPLEDLRNPGRVHIDALGNVHLCQGLCMGNIGTQSLSSLIKSYDPDTHPVCGPILKGGPAQLARQYSLDHDSGYVDACHLCTSLCKGLLDRFPGHLAPRQVYGLDG